MPIPGQHARDQDDRALITALLTAGDGLSALQIADTTRLPVHAVYPALARLEAARRITGRWEPAPPHRRLYYLANRLTGKQQTSTLTA